MYSGVVSVFCDRMLRGEVVEIFGDGRQMRDFIHVSDVVEYLLRAMEAPSVDGDVFNVCTGNPIAIAELGKLIAELRRCEFKARFHPPRQGDIRNSAGDPSRAVMQFGYLPEMSLRRGLGEFLSTLGSVRKREAPRHALAVPAGR
jgi:UDP-glucose 4-epimerase